MQINSLDTIFLFNQPWFKLVIFLPAPYKVNPFIKVGILVHNTGTGPRALALHLYPEGDWVLEYKVSMLKRKGSLHLGMTHHVLSEHKHPSKPSHHPEDFDFLFLQGNWSFCSKLSHYLIIVRWAEVNWKPVLCYWYILTLSAQHFTMKLPIPKTFTAICMLTPGLRSKHTPIPQRSRVFPLWQ